MHATTEGIESGKPKGFWPYQSQGQIMSSDMQYSCDRRLSRTNGGKYLPNVPPVLYCCVDCQFGRNLTEILGFHTS